MLRLEGLFLLSSILSTIPPIVSFNSSTNKSSPFLSFCSDTAGNAWCSANKDFRHEQDHPPFLLESAVAAYKRRRHFRFYKVLLFGGSTADGEIRTKSTWIYTPWTNSWEKKSFKSAPQNRFGHGMKTICKTRVVMYGGYLDNGNQTRTNDTWIFQGESETWTRPLLLRGVAPINAFYGSTSIYQPKSNCSCKESFISVGGSRLGSDVIELRCLNEEQNLYQWVYLAKSNPHHWFPVAGNISFMTVVPATPRNSTHLYVNGGALSETIPTPFLWLVDLLKNEWKLLSDYSSDPDMTKAAKTGGGKLFHILSSNSLLLIDQSRAFAFNLLTNRWMNVSCRFCSPPKTDFSRPSKSSVKIGNTVLVFGTSEVIPDQQYNSVVLNVSILSVDSKANAMKIAWVANPPSKSSPSPLSPGTFSSAIFGESLYVFGGLGFDASLELLQYNSAFLNSNSVWILNLNTLSWHQQNAEVSPSARANHCGAMADDLFVQFGGNSGQYEMPVSLTFDSLLDLRKVQLTKFKSTLLDSVQAFNVTQSYWLALDTVLAKEVPSRRFRCSMASMSNGSVLMFGGLAVSSSLRLQSLNDLWMLTIIRKNVVLWRNLSPACMLSRHCNGPLPRFNNVFKFSKGTAVVFGGVVLNGSISGTCLDQYVWRFHLKTSTWKKQDVRSQSPNLPTSRKNEAAATNCFSAGDFIGEKLFVSFRYLQQPNCHSTCKIVAKQKTETFVLDYYSQDPATWIKLGSLPNDIVQSDLLSYDGTIVSIGTFSAVNFKQINTPSITILLKPGCPQGMFSPDFWQSPCQFCGISKYAPVSSNACASCPIGLTTKFFNSSGVEGCECSFDYCKHGSCTIHTKVGSQVPSVLCSCNVGFTGKRCQYPTYFLIGAGAITLSSLFTLLAVAVYRTKKENANKAAKLSQLQKTLSITENEIQILDRIDQECRGGYSKVYKATYRGMKHVAVKNLLMDLAEIDETVLLEFIREIEVMSLLSHRNIVKFFGAGRFEKSNDPFLVLEYVKRGSLCSILYPSPNLVTFRQKFQFSLDGALGMEYLHNLKCPRIHRDLKTANILVDRNWVVKIADFGCAKLLFNEGEPLRPKKRRSARNSVNGSSSNLLEEGLLPEKSMTVWHIGTLYWCAPEILLQQAYGTPADVYRYDKGSWVMPISLLIFLVLALFFGKS